MCNNYLLYENMFKFSFCFLCRIITHKFFKDTVQINDNCLKLQSNQKYRKNSHLTLCLGKKYFMSGGTHGISKIPVIQ